MPEFLICSRCGSSFSKELLNGMCPSCIVHLLCHPEATADRDGLRALRAFGDYELLEEIDRGGMGVVYKARQTSLNRLVAIKMILAGELASPAEVQRFRAEAEAAANLQHPNIVAIHESGEWDGQHFFSMDYVPGQNLSELVPATDLKNPEWPRRAATLARTIARAIQFAHEQGTLHRDLKPSNILIDQSGEPHITDFGLAKRMKLDSALTLSGQVLGTPNFMAPEQVLGKRGVVGASADIYSLGAILYFALTARPPFLAETVHETLNLVSSADPVPPKVLNPVVPRDLQTICLACLEKDPRRRYASAGDLAEDLANFLRGEPITARPVRWPEKCLRKCLRHRLTTALSTAVVLLLLAFGLFVLRPRLGSPKHPIQDMPTRSGAGTAVLMDDNVYVTTATAGNSEQWESLLHVWHSKTNAWQQLASSAIPHVGGAGAAIAGKLYLAGGEFHGSRDTLEIYEPKANRWRNGPPMHTARSAFAAVVLAGKLYALGGWNSVSPALDVVESFDPARELWTTEPRMPTPRSGFEAASLRGAIYVFGGTDVGRNLLDSAAAWTPGGAWTNKGTMPKSMCDSFVAVAGDIVYIAGGHSLSETALFLAYDASKDKWYQLEPMPESRYGGSGAVMLDGEMYCFGGWQGLPGVPALPRADVFVYNPLQNLWRRSSGAGR